MNDSSVDAGSIVCVGEVLWDSLPLGLFLGGAPFNVGYHCHQLGRPVQVASRVGADVLGEEVRRRCRWKGISDRLIQEDEKLATGLVRIELDARGEPDYTIVEPVAWDRLAWSPELERSVERAEVVVFGTLAQRAKRSRATIRRTWDTGAALAYDVNLRPPFVDREVVRSSLRASNWVKLNADELGRLGGWFGLRGKSDTAEGAARRLADRFELEVVCVTRGSDGAGLLREKDWVRRGAAPIEVTDAVGAGDAFMAVLLDGLIADEPSGAILEQANRLGAYVATQMGATPAHDPEVLDRISVSE